MRNYELTHQKLLKKGLSLFTETSFEETNVRRICLLANVTTGAFYKHFSSKEQLLEELVDPYLKCLIKIYDKIINHFKETICYQKKDVKYLSKNALLDDYWKKNQYNLDPIIDYMYLNPQITKLVFFKSSGSQYSNIVNNVCLFAERKAIKILKWLKHQQLITKDLNDDDHLGHLYIYSYLSIIIEILSHEYSLLKSKKLIHEFYLFMMPSWLSYLHK